LILQGGGKESVQSLSSIRRLSSSFPLSSPPSPSLHPPHPIFLRDSTPIAVDASWLQSLSNTQIPAQISQMQPNIGRNYPHARRGRFVHSPIFSLQSRLYLTSSVTTISYILYLSLILPYIPLNFLCSFKLWPIIPRTATRGIKLRWAPLPMPI
jgi:hypothetical protein